MWKWSRLLGALLVSCWLVYGHGLPLALKPAAQAELDRLTQEESVKQRQAQAVNKLENEISAIKKKHDVLSVYLPKKCTGQRHLYDFCEMLGRNEKNHWSEPGFMVSCSKVFRICPSRSASSARTKKKNKMQGQKFSLKWEFEIIGEEFIKAGDYVESFFADVETSRFWVEHGFVSKPILDLHW